MSKKWLKVSARITRSKIKRAEVFGFGVPRRFTYAEIVFEYVVNGKWYTSRNVSFSLLHPSAVEWVERYPVYALAQAYYHPLLPKISVLEPGLPAKEAAILAICFGWASVMVTAGLWVMIANTL